MNHLSDLEKEELNELIGNIHKNNQIRFFIFSAFLLFGFLLKITGLGIPSLVIEIIALIFFINIICEYFARKVWLRQTVNQASLGYFILQITEVTALLIAISYFDATLFGGIAVLMLYVMFCYLGFTRRIYPRLITLCCGVGYIAMASLEYFGITKYHDFYNTGVDLYQNHPLFKVTTLFMLGFYICFAFYGDVFLKKMRNTIEILREKTKELTEKERELREAKTALEIKVEARTEELKELAENLEEQVRERTRELQEKISELQKFQKLTVGRELKMIEFKREIKELKNQLESKD